MPEVPSEADSEAEWEQRLREEQDGGLEGGSAWWGRWAADHHLFIDPHTHMCLLCMS